MGALFFKLLSGGLFLSEMGSVIYHQNRQKMNYPFLGSFFAQVLVGNKYKRFCVPGRFLVKFVE